MILNFDDTCWTNTNPDWQRSLIELLLRVKFHSAHAVLAHPESMLTWCSNHLPLFLDYFKGRLQAAQPRSNSLEIRVSPNGNNAVSTTPPWTLIADTTKAIIDQPLAVVMENDTSDQRFLLAAVPSFSSWCDQNWIRPVMGGGSAMSRKITTASSDSVKQWRSFFIFDSDRLHPDELAIDWTPPTGDGCQGHSFETQCANIPRSRWHRLRRRSIENYLPASVLQNLDQPLTEAIFSHDVGEKAHFFNMKHGLRGDGISPPNPQKQVRANRSQGIWTILPPDYISKLENGFGKNVADQFLTVPHNHSWPSDVADEMFELASCIQDAI